MPPKNLAPNPPPPKPKPCAPLTPNNQTDIKVDGCGDNSYYPGGYKAMGAALEATGREIVYSCSWPAYIGDDESVKPFNTFIMDGSFPAPRKPEPRAQVTPYSPL